MGWFLWEVYAAKPCAFWLNPSYTDGHDELRHGALHVNPYQYADEAEDPAFADFWQLLRRNGIPFRLRWGKLQPRGTAWLRRIAEQHRKDDFLARRASLDSNDMF